MPLRTPVFMSVLCFFATACSDDGGALGPFAGDGAVVFEGSPGSLATTGGDIFIANEAEGVPIVSKLSTSQEVTTQVAGPLGASVTEIVTDGEWLAWVESQEAGGDIFHMRLPDGIPQKFLGPLESPTIAIHQGTLYAAASDAVVAIPLNGGIPASMAENVGAVRAMATDEQHLYIAQAYDAPNGRIVRIPLTPGPHAPEVLIDGLGTPLTLLLTGDDVCWREFQGGLLQCASKATGTPRQLGANLGFLAVSSPKFVADDTSLFVATNHDIQRVSLTGGPSQVVARLPEFSFVHALVLVGDMLYFSDGSSLRSITKTNVVVSENNTPNNLPTGVGCPSPFDGTYIGQFEYEYQQGDPAPPPLTPVQDAVQVTIELKCIADAQGTATLNVAHAVADHPYFGCQLAGCTPLYPSLALLPSDLPVSTGSPLGSGLILRFPNGTSLGTTNGVGALRISSDGRTISNSLDPAYENATWTPCCETFPPETQGAVKYKSWILTKSAL